MVIDLNKPAPDISNLIAECEHAEQDVVHFFKTQYGVVASVVTKSGAESLWDRLCAAWHVFMGHEMEIVLHEPIVDRIVARCTVLKAQLTDEVAKETFALTGKEDVLAVGDKAAPAPEVVGEVTEPAPAQ